ncbi:MAG TPA: hypothetical protein DDZ80_29205 [Cyanobacteria bacterium UBA8803]|nr:hypothetical protein [Cyanobacteria bacterium UBA9273]HBL62328.1 hypothetical protein [Cyanobacteria bacterium UBA8803]
MKKPLFLSCSVLLIAGLGATSPSTPITIQTPLAISQLSQGSGNSTRAVQPKIELLDAGAQPRQQLTFKPAANAKQTTLLTMEMDMVGTVDGQVMPTLDFPTVTMTLESQVTKVDANGDIHIELFYSDVAVASDTTAPPEVIETMRSQLQAITQMRMSYAIDNQGKTKNVKVVLPENLDPNIKPWIEQMLSSLEQLSGLPFPGEAVGVGAKWRLSSPLPDGGIPLNNLTVLYELVTIQDNSLDVKFTMEPQSTPQALSEFNLPGLPPGLDVDIKSFALQSTGTITLGLDRILPTSGTMSVGSTMEFAIKEPNSKAETLLNMRSSIKITMNSQ